MPLTFPFTFFASAIVALIAYNAFTGRKKVGR